MKRRVKIRKASRTDGWERPTKVVLTPADRARSTNSHPSVHAFLGSKLGGKQGGKGSLVFQNGLLWLHFGGRFGVVTSGFAGVTLKKWLSVAEITYFCKVSATDNL